MNIFWKYVVVLSSLHFGVNSANAQGCSDAGICSAPGLRPTEHADSGTNHLYDLSTGLGYGTAQFGVHIIAGFTEFNRTFSKRLLLSGKVSYSLNSGPLGTNAGLSDFLLTTAYRFESGLSPLVGIKMPFNKADRRMNGRPLPMAYQSTLGTTDLLVGLSLVKEKWTLSLGYQQPLNRNLNSFDTSLYLPGEINERFLPTVNFKRRADVIARFFYRVPFRNKRLSLLPGLLPIFHIANDSYIDATGVERELSGSRGLTLNINAVLLYSVSKSGGFRFTLGAPAIARKKRPEGLQKFSVVVEYATSF